MVKQTTISVRLADDLLSKFDAVTRILPLGKSDFIRACIQKLCEDNELLVDHSHKVDQYLESIKKEISKLPENMLIVRNGSWKDVSNSTILILCDELWKTSKSVFSEWQKLTGNYEIKHEHIPDFAAAEESDGLLDLGAIALLATKKKTSIEPTDLLLFLEDELWSDQFEISRISLSYSVNKVLEQKLAEKVIRDYIKSEERTKRVKPLRVSIDAKGEFRRSGGLLYLPVKTEKIESPQ